MSQDLQSTEDRILAVVPQQYNFRFLDKILEISKERIVGQYTFDSTLPFYAGQEAGKVRTPETILIETMAQTVVVALGLYLIECDNQTKAAINPAHYLTLFTEVEAEFYHDVPPGETVTIHGEKLMWRFRKIKSKASLYLSNGVLAGTATMSGMGVKK